VVVAAEDSAVIVGFMVLRGEMEVQKRKEER
jgi:hypothetical protein